MKIHIVQRDDTFQTIAEKYSVSVQDLIGMNTHINHLAPLVPGLKVKVPSPARKEAPNVAQHIQKYYPNIDTETIDLQTASTAEPVVKKVQPIPVVKEVVKTETVVPQPAVVQTQVATPQTVVTQTEVVSPQPVKVEEAIPIPLKPLPTEQPATGPNDGIKVTGTQQEEYKVSFNQGYYQGPPTYTKPTPPPIPYPYGPSCTTGPVPYPNPYQYPTPYPAPYPNPYQYPTPYPAPAPYPNPNPYAMTRGQDDRFFIGGFGYPFFGGYGWGGYPFFGGYGWGGNPYYGGWGGQGYGGWRSPSSCSGGYPY